MKLFIQYRLLLVLLILGLNGTSFIIQADEVKAPSISPWLYKQLSNIESLIASQAYPQARKQLEKILPELKKDSYGQALALRSLASVYALENQYTKAAKYLKQCLAMNKLPAEQHQQALLNLGQLYMAMEQYQQAVNILHAWVQQNPHSKNEQVHVLLANAYAQLKQYRKALPYIKQVIKQAKKPKESWLQLNLAIDYELGDYSAAASILQKLVLISPDKKDYWQQLSATYQQTKQFSKALAVQNLAYKKGLIKTESQILQLFNLMMYNKQPYQAALLLSKEIQARRVQPNSAHWELLANAWTGAREYKLASQALEKAANKSNKGELFLQLARLHIEQERWQPAIKALQKAIEKPGIKNKGKAYILLGMSLYETQQINASIKAFKKAKQYRKTSKAAKQWLNYIQQG